ncbi:MAG: hypothetical protein AB1498_12800 [bacterium]
MLLSCFAYMKGISDTHIFYLNEEAGLDVLIMGFDAENSLPTGQSALKTGYIEIESGELRGSIIFKEL